MWKVNKGERKLTSQPFALHFKAGPENGAELSGQKPEPSVQVESGSDGHKSNCHESKKKIPDYLTSLLLSLFFKFKSKTSLKIMYNWIFLK